MRSKDYDQEISQVSASRDRMRTIGIALAVCILSVIVYIVLSDNFSDNNDQHNGDASSFSLNYSKRYSGDQYASLNMPATYSKKNTVISELDALNPKKDSSAANTVDTKSKTKDQALATRLSSSMVVVYEKNGFLQQQNIATRERLKRSDTKLTKEAMLRKMIAHNKKTANEQFAEKAYSADVEITDASKLHDLNYTILQGKNIAAILETPINTNLPGMIKAVVSRNVYGERGKIPLIPKGSRLIGTYNSSTIQGQARVYIIWTRIVTPNYVNIMVNSPGADQMGMAGMSGKVNNHFFKRFGNSVLLSIIGAGTMIAGANSSDQYNSISSIREQAASNFNAMSNTELSKSVGIPPTITVAQGTRVTVQVARDIKFTQVKDRY